LRIHFKQIIQS